MPDTMINRIATAMQSSPAWPAVFDAGTAEMLARVALETVREPTDAMIDRAAKALYAQVNDNHALPWEEMMDAHKALYAEDAAAMIDAALSETT